MRSTWRPCGGDWVLVPSVSAKRVKLWSYTDLMALRIIYWLRQQKTSEAGLDIPRTSMASIRRDPRAETLEGERLAGELFDPIAPFTTREGTHGPDLATPRPNLRIVPGKLSGAPHVVSTRLETRVLRALEEDGYSIGEIRRLCPFVSEEQIAEALALEHQLERNLEIGAAA